MSKDNWKIAPLIRYMSTTKLYVEHIPTNTNYTFNISELQTLSESDLKEKLSNKLTDVCIMDGFKKINKFKTLYEI